MKCYLSKLKDTISGNRRMTIREWENILHLPEECEDCKHKIERIKLSHRRKDAKSRSSRTGNMSSK